MINVINGSLTFWWLHCTHKLSPKWLLFYDFWQQMRRACIDQNIVCTPCVFWSKAAVRIFHFISSLKAEHFITYLARFWFSICPSPSHPTAPPPLSFSFFISLHGCARDSVRAHPSGCFFAKSFVFRTYLFILPISLCDLEIHCCWEARLSRARRFLLDSKV